MVIFYDVVRPTQSQTFIQLTKLPVKLAFNLFLDYVYSLVAFLKQIQSKFQKQTMTRYSKIEIMRQLIMMIFWP